MRLGKLIKTTGDKCPRCLIKHLQVREVDNKKFLQCSCGYQARFEKQTRRNNQKRGEIEVENFGE